MSRRFQARRRHLLRLAGLAALSAGNLRIWGGGQALAAKAQANNITWRHGLSIFDDLKYPANFEHLDYVNPAAPKGGMLRFQPGYWYNNQNTQTFNTLNAFVTKGDAPPRIEYCFDSLMTRAVDEPDALYGLVAKQLRVEEDGALIRFALRPEAHFHDGSPLRAEDVAFSFDILKKKGHPSLRETARPLIAVEAENPQMLVMRLDENRSAKTAMMLAGYPIFSKAYYQSRQFDAATLDPPLGSGPYRVGAMEAGSYIEYERVADYWARDLAIARGQYNFQTLRIDFYGDRQVAFEAFKKGDIDIREEFISRQWVKGYDFPAMQEGRAIKKLFPAEKRPSLQGWFINQRRQKFADPRTREAIGLCFDFEWTNANVFYGAYQRASSFFGTSDFAAKGAPQGAERELLQGFADQLPKEIFADAYMPPISDGSGSDRNLLARAVRLLSSAGFKREGTRLVDVEGTELTIEFLIRSASFERVLAGFLANLDKIGITANIRLVDPAQYQARLNEYDFDITGYAMSLTPTPIDGLKTLFGAKAAKTPGGSNLAGIQNPVIDQLIGRAQQAKSRADLQIHLRAIDRILRHYHYWIPNWFSPHHRMAFWDKYGWPEVKPDYFFAPEAWWWEDEKKAAKLKTMS